MTQSNPANRDPLSDAPGAHPVGTGIGAAGGAVTGAAFGAMGGPIGAAVGGVAGAVVGGLAGKGAAEAVNPTSLRMRDRISCANKVALGFPFLFIVTSR